MAKDDAQGERFGDALLSVAEAQVKEGNYGVAVIVAAAVIEATVDQAFDRLFVLNVPYSRGVMHALLTDRTFLDSRRTTRTLWTALTGDDITKPKPEWKAYKDHVERRNRVTHGGVEFTLGKRKGEFATRDDAEASIQAVRDMRAHVERVVAEAEAEIDDACGEGASRNVIVRELRRLDD